MGTCLKMYKNNWIKNIKWLHTSRLGAQRSQIDLKRCYCPPPFFVFFFAPKSPAFLKPLASTPSESDPHLLDLETWIMPGGYSFWVSLFPSVVFKTSPRPLQLIFKNAATLFCFEAPETFCGLRIFPWLSISLGLSG